MRAEVILLVPSCSLCSSGLHQGVGGGWREAEERDEFAVPGSVSQLPATLGPSRLPSVPR